MIVAVPAIRAGGGYVVSPHFGRAPLFVIAEVSGGSYRILEVVENPHALHERGRGAGVASLLLSRGVKAVVALGVGPGAFERLRSAGVAVHYVPPNAGPLVPIERALELFAQGRLEEAREAREFD